jgi:hypothetical protein
MDPVPSSDRQFLLIKIYCIAVNIFSLFVLRSLPRNGSIHHNIFVLEYMVVYSVTRHVIINFKYRDIIEFLLFYTILLQFIFSLFLRYI